MHYAIGFYLLFICLQVLKQVYEQKRIQRNTDNGQQRSQYSSKNGNWNKITISYGLHSNEDKPYAVLHALEAIVWDWVVGGDFSLGNSEAVAKDDHCEYGGDDDGDDGILSSEAFEDVQNVEVYLSEAADAVGSCVCEFGQAYESSENDVKLEEHEHGEDVVDGVGDHHLVVQIVHFEVKSFGNDGGVDADDDDFEYELVQIFFVVNEDTEAVAERVVLLLFGVIDFMLDDGEFNYNNFSADDQND